MYPLRTSFRYALSRVASCTRVDSHQDLWGSFARTGDPNPSHAYLSTRGFNSTLSTVRNWTWPRFDIAWASQREIGHGEVLGSGNEGVAALDWPTPGKEGLPDVERCEIVLDVEPVM